MVLTNFNGAGVGFGFGIGCGFGFGWGFGDISASTDMIMVVHKAGDGSNALMIKDFLHGMPLNFLGLGVGGGCGVGVGLGWGFGAAFGCQYRNSRVIFQGIDFNTRDSSKVSESKDLSKSTQKVHASH